MAHTKLNCLPELAPQASFALLLSDRMFNDDSCMLITSSKTGAWSGGVKMQLFGLNLILFRQANSQAEPNRWETLMVEKKIHISKMKGPSRISHSVNDILSLRQSVFICPLSSMSDSVPKTRPLWIKAEGIWTRNDDCNYMTILSAQMNDFATWDLCPFID